MARISRLVPPWVPFLHAVWLAILVGLGIEILCLAFQTGLLELPPTATILADTLQRVSWSVLVCAGLAAGLALPRGPAIASSGCAMSLIGVLSAPVAFAAARALHQAVLHAANGEPGAAAGPLVFAVAGIRAAEYGVFGYVLARLVRLPPPKWRGYVSLGAAIGATFGTVTLITMNAMSATAVGVAVNLVRAVNELAFPIGCALVLYATARTTTWATTLHAAPPSFEEARTEVYTNKSGRSARPGATA